jgi:hypothetical protein
MPVRQGWSLNHDLRIRAVTPVSERRPRLLLQLTVERNQAITRFDYWSMSAMAILRQLSSGARLIHEYGSEGSPLGLAKVYSTLRSDCFVVYRSAAVVTAKKVESHKRVANQAHCVYLDVFSRMVAPPPVITTMSGLPSPLKSPLSSACPPPLEPI